MTIAPEVGADVLESDRHYPSGTGGWQLGDLDLGEHLRRHRDQRLVLILSPLGREEPETYTCGISG